jgi:hypothetical protein
VTLPRSSHLPVLQYYTSQLVYQRIGERLVASSLSRAPPRVPSGSSAPATSSRMQRLAADAAVFRRQWRQSIYSRTRKQLRDVLTKSHSSSKCSASPKMLAFLYYFQMGRLLTAGASCPLPILCFGLSRASSQPRTSAVNYSIVRPFTFLLLDHALILQQLHHQLGTSG